MKKPTTTQPADGKVRRSQMVSTFGPGSMVDLLTNAVLVGGLDFWEYNGQVETIHEPRLRDAIATQFKELGRELSQESPFRAPPEGNDREPTKQRGVGVLEFPQWFVCQNPQCRALERKNGLDLKNGRYLHHCTRTKSETCVPVRFVLACTRGHLNEINWNHFAHGPQSTLCSSPRLTFEEGPSGDFQDIRVTCACGANTNLSKARDGMKLKCDGDRPWLGIDGRETCEDERTRQVRLLVRTASNSYFAQTVSALSIPDPDQALTHKVREHWGTLKNLTLAKLPMYREDIDVLKFALDGYSDEDVFRTIQALHSDKPAAPAPLRTAEYKQFVSSSLEAIGELPPHDATFFARAIEPRHGLPTGVAKLILAPRLREVIAQIGFTRLEPVTPDVQGEYDLGVQTAALGLSTTWLPATEIRGEGVFLALDEAAVQEWENRPEVIARGKALLAGYNAWASEMKQAPPFPGVRFYLLHSLSHLLLSAISLECGYAASALRERIYAGPSARDATPMAAILISTGTSGTEGTLGGLVEQGRQLQNHLRHAWDLGQLCSNDPVCASHNPDGDHAERYLEGAACHGCLFVAECSCERFNRYLDRALVVPTLGHPAALAFFSKRP